KGGPVSKRRDVVLLDFQGQTAPNLFPITLQVFAQPMAEGDKTLHTVTVEGSGVLEVPVAAFKGRKVVTITTFADGTVTEYTATGVPYLAGAFSSRQERGGFRVVPL